MKTYRCNPACSRYILGLSALLLSGCVAWVDRAPPEEVSGIEAAGEHSSTIAVVRRKQFALSGVTFTISVDGVPIANLESGQYTRFQAPPDEHVLLVRWHIGGLNIFGAAPGGSGHYGDPVRAYEKQTSINCKAGTTCLISIEAKPFATREEDRVILNLVRHANFSLEGLTFAPPGVTKPKK